MPIRPIVPIPNPFEFLGNAVSSVAAGAWTAIMLALWNAGLWVLRFVLGLMDRYLIPDLSADGPISGAYQVVYWASAFLVIIMGLIQLGVAGFRRDGRGLAQLVIGLGQYLVIWGAWVGYTVAVVRACSALTSALMMALLDVYAWSEWEPWSDVDLSVGGVEVVTATVLGILGLFLWLAAIGHFLVFLARAAALLVLAAVTPIAAAGLVSDYGRTWFWKSLRWFHAAALTPVLMVLVLGVGVQVSTGVARGATDSAEFAIGSALPGVMLIVVSCFAPLALFRLLAFVDPGTSSGAAMRQGLAGVGGLAGLVGGSRGSSSSAAPAAAGALAASHPAAAVATMAAQSNSSGQSKGEAQSSATTQARMSSALSSLGGGLGRVAASGMRNFSNLGASATSVGTDTMNQAGVGDAAYYPDAQRPVDQTSRNRKAQIADQSETTPGGAGSGSGSPSNGQSSPTGPTGPGAQGGAGQ